MGAKINLFGRPTTLMACDLKTGIWLEYHIKGLRAIKESIELVLRKFELVQLKSSLSDTSGVNKVRADCGPYAGMQCTRRRPRPSFLPLTKPASVILAAALLVRRCSASGSRVRRCHPGFDHVRLSYLRRLTEELAELRQASSAAQIYARCCGRCMRCGSGWRATGQR